MTGWLIALGILILLAILPLGVSGIYNEDGPRILLLVGPVRVKLFPKKKKEKKPSDKKKGKKKKSRDGSAEKKKKADKKGGNIKDFLPLVKVILDFLSGFHRKLRVNRLDLTIILAGSDPCDLGINYGKAWTALGNLTPYLDRALVIRKRRLEVECDFTADKTLVLARVDLTITLGRLLTLVVVYGIRALKEYIEIMNKRKGGAQ